MTDKALQRANELIQQHQICECGHLRWWSTNGKAGHWHTERGWCMECACKEFRPVRFTVTRVDERTPQQKLNTLKESVERFGRVVQRGKILD